MNYDAALDRALEELPDQPREGGDRLSVPDPVGQTDGAFTRLTNLEDIASALSREAKHVHRTIQREFGTNGQFDGSEARYNGSFSVNDFEAAIDAYIAEYVTCSECGLPDTRLTTEDGVDMLRCEACGAFRPVTKRSTKNTQTDRPTLEEGKTYKVEITGTGREGDGVAEKGKYTIFVPGAQEGDVVDAYIENISGTLAFARLA
jgi:translation initiation factor 2 subunit 2